MSARSTPRSPEIEQHNLASQIAQSAFYPIRIVHHDVWCLIPLNVLAVGGLSLLRRRRFNGSCSVRLLEDSFQFFEIGRARVIGLQGIQGDFVQLLVFRWIQRLQRDK